MSFSRRLTLAAAGAVAAAILVLSGLTYVIVRAELRGEVDDSLRQQAGRADQIGFRERGPRPAGPRPGFGPRPGRGAFAGPGPGPGGAGASPPPPPDELPGQVPDAPGGQLGGARGYVQIVTGTGRAARPPGAGTALPITSRTIAVANGDVKEFLNDATVDGTHLRILTMRGPIDGVALQIARPLTEVDSVLSRLRWILLAVSVAGVALAAAAGLLVARSALGPVRRLTGAAEHVAATQDLSQRIDAGERDELGRLASAFNRMLEALNLSRTAQRRLVADASHELRTPLTSMRANLELLQAGDRLPAADREATLRDLVSQTDELTGLVGDLVDLARDGEAPLERDVVRLDEVVRTAVKRARLRAPALRFDDSHVEPTEVMGDSAALERAVVNLLDNAVKYSPPEGPVEVAVHGGQISVRDHGPGIPDDDLPLVFDRFYRSADARSQPGSGLGLAIVRQVADAHGGSAFARHAPGGGALLVLSVPPLDPAG